MPTSWPFKCVLLITTGTLRPLLEISQASQDTEETHVTSKDTSVFTSNPVFTVLYEEETNLWAINLNGLSQSLEDRHDRAVKTFISAPPTPWATRNVKLLSNLSPPIVSFEVLIIFPLMLLVQKRHSLSSFNIWICKRFPEEKSWWFSLTGRKTSCHRENEASCQRQRKQALLFLVLKAAPEGSQTTEWALNWCRHTVCSMNEPDALVCTHTRAYTYMCDIYTNLL